MATPAMQPRAGSWEATFPARQESESESTLFMKRMLYVTFSQIIRFRLLLPDASFKKRKFDGIRLGVFSTNDPLAAETALILRGACEALDKKYLKELILVINEDDNDEDCASEVYTMRVVYGGEESNIELTNGKTKTQIRYRGPEHVRVQTKRLLMRIIQITGFLDTLPPKAYFGFRITYYDECTPKGYQPTGFAPTKVLYNMVDEADSISAGQVHTKLHACFVDIKSKYIEDHMELEERLSADHATLDAIRGSTNTTMDMSVDGVMPMTTTADSLVPPFKTPPEDPHTRMEQIIESVAANAASSRPASGGSADEEAAGTGKGRRGAGRRGNAGKEAASQPKQQQDLVAATLTAAASRLQLTEAQGVTTSSPGQQTIAQALAAAFNSPPRGLSSSPRGRRGSGNGKVTPREKTPVNEGVMDGGVKKKTPGRAVQVVSRRVQRSPRAA